jgi:hypothetical protein
MAYTAASMYYKLCSGHSRTHALLFNYGNEYQQQLGDIPRSYLSIILNSDYMTASQVDQNTIGSVRIKG